MQIKMSDFDYSDRTKNIFKGDIARDFSSDITGYESPITGYVRSTIEDLNVARDEAIVSTIREQYAIDCNREELIKALAYDRNQYNKGYSDGYEVARKTYEKPQGEWLIGQCHPHNVYCSNCFKTYAQAGWEVWKDGSLARDYCPNCGADMTGKINTKSALMNSINYGFAEEDD